MFGSYRTFLAFMVVFLHLGKMPALGDYAVFAFFTLSGFLMTMIMHGTYRYSSSGLKKYALNRVLRIFPTYWFVLILTLVIFMIIPIDKAHEFNSHYGLPNGIGDWLGNLLIIITDRKGVALIPPAWALTIELFYYTLIGLGLSRCPKMTMFWFLLSVAYTIGFHLLELDWYFWGYFSLMAASLPFSTGALLYHYGDSVVAKIGLVKHQMMPLFLLVLIVFNWFISYKLGILRGIGFYVNFALNVVMILSLYHFKGLGILSKKMDSFMGDLSYPVYLNHVLVGLVCLEAFKWLDLPLTQKSELFALACTPVILLFSHVIVVLVDKPVNRVRSKVKNTKS